MVGVGTKKSRKNSYLIAGSVTVGYKKAVAQYQVQGSASY